MQNHRCGRQSVMMMCSCETFSQSGSDANTISPRLFRKITSWKTWPRDETNFARHCSSILFWPIHVYDVLHPSSCFTRLGVTVSKCVIRFVIQSSRIEQNIGIPKHSDTPLLPRPSAFGNWNRRFHDSPRYKLV